MFWEEERGLKRKRKGEGRRIGGKKMQRKKERRGRRNDWRKERRSE